ncbi:hypothetical protein [Bradyrhizobium sp. Leo170]|uniref:phage head completion protein n=1 Tax=Bradyrhizobium sp. Leo170 TaxID=1571199 RepID=UPI00102E2FE5|nr:hypothetical protein [Bradyrhizobium sp. Leo170]TAI61584.1 hypothetical protein CWO89_34340 [Bradyrhizobium sp. Leo170]
MASKEPKSGPKIANFSHRVALCTMKDVVDQGGTMVLARPAVAWVWAGIRQPRPSFMSPYGYAVLEEADRVTHIITIRGNAGIDITSAAWVYEKFRISPPRWYKVVGFSDVDRWIRLACRLVERSDTAQPSQSELSAARQDVVL